VLARDEAGARFLGGLNGTLSAAGGIRGGGGQTLAKKSSGVGARGAEQFVKGLTFNTHSKRSKQKKQEDKEFAPEDGETWGRKKDNRPN